MTYTLYYNATQITNAQDISYNFMMKSMSSLTFKLQVNHFTDFDTWESRKFTDKIYLYNDSVIEWEGYIMSLSAVDKEFITVTCISILSELEWDVLLETDDNKFVVDTVFFDSLATNYSILCKTAEGVSPAWTTSQYISPVRYAAIISDKTTGATEEELMAYSFFDVESSNLTLSSTSGAQLDDFDDDYITVTGIDNNDYLTVKFQNETIENSNNITHFKLEVQCYGQANVNYDNRAIFEWRKNGTLVDTITNIKITTVGADQLISFTYEQDITSTSDWFYDNGSYWVAEMRIRFTEGNNTWGSFKIDKVSCLVDHESSTFETINAPLYGQNVSTIQIYKDDMSTYRDLSASGLNDGDQIDIVMQFNDAVNRCNTSSSISLDVPEIKKGVSQTYVNILNLVALQNIFEEFNLQWFERISDNIFYLKAIDEEDIAAATITYDKDNDAPNWGTVLDSEDNIFGAVRVKYTGGITDKIYPDTPNSNPRTKIIDAKWLVTPAGAKAYGLKLANYYSVEHRSIKLLWNYEPTNIPQVGVKYDINLLQHDGADTFDTLAYEDQICRKVSFNLPDFSSNPTYTAFFGGGSTPADEKLGKYLGKLNRDKQIEDGIADTKYHSAITRYNQLDGIPTSFIPSSHGNEAHSSTFITATGVTYENLNANSDVVKVSTGLFNALYNFEFDTIGENPTDWTISETAGSINIIRYLDGHSNIVEMYDNSSGSNVVMVNMFDSGQTSGSVELWARLSNNTKVLLIAVADGGTGNYAGVLFNSGYIQNSSASNLVAFVADTWYHIKIVFDCASNYSIFINDTEYSGNSFVGTPTEMDRLQINTGTPATGFYGYVDAIDYSWASGYTAGRNKTERKVLSIYE